MTNIHEIRLQETLAEAKRHHKNYVELRDQYNDFVDGRLNKMIDAVLGNNLSHASPDLSARSMSNKAN